MTKKDYVAIARVISDGQFINCPTAAEYQINLATRSKIGRQLADVCASDNPRFDRARFLAACGVQS